MAAWQHWQAVQSQWATGMGGATGLRFEGVRAYLDEEGLQGGERREVWAGIRVCEAATLQAWAELQSKDQ